MWRCPLNTTPSDRNVTVVAELDRRAGGVWKLRTPVLSHEREHFIGTSEIENTYFIHP